jgi:glycosyltransferase involved in cell wall biosynthesis
MKIAMIGSRGIDSDYSGVETSLREICPRLVRRGHEVWVFSEPQRSGVSSIDGVNIARVRSLHGKHTETLSRSGMATLMSVFDDFDVINFHAQGSGIFSPVCRLFRKRCVVTVHGLDWMREKWSGLARYCLKAAEQVGARHASRVTVVAKNLCGYFQQTYGLDAAFIPNGIAPRPRLHRPDLLRPYGLAPGDYVLFASRLVPEKGCHELIQAYNGIRTDKKLVIAGGGRYTERYAEELKRMADPDKVIFTGHLRGELLQELFDSAYLFVLPSHLEGLSNALLEALGYEKCVLVSDIPENLGVIDGHGYSFRVGDTGDLRQKLGALLESEERVRAAESRVRGFVRDTYDWDRIAEKYEQAYASVL